MSNYQLSIDGSGAKEGSQEIVKSFADIKAAAEKMEGGVTAAARKASDSFANLQKNVKPISAQAIDSLKQLSTVFKGFRGPSDAAVRNTIIFLQGLKSVGTLNLGRVAGLGSLLSAISGYKGPSATAGRNTLALLNALRFISSFSAPRGLASLLTSLSTFKGPSAAAARNTTALLAALNSFRAGPGIAAAVSALGRLATAAEKARSSMNSLKGSIPSSINIKANTAQAQSAMNKLLGSSNALQTAIFKTQTAWNALGGIFAGRAIVGASNDLIKIHAQLEAATGSAQQAAIQFNYLAAFSNKMGLEFTTAAKSFGFFLGAVKGTNLTLRESREIFAGFSTAARALQLSTSDVDGIFRALGQMMSKGKIQAEELRGQLGDRLPGAFARFAVALHMTKPGELDAALKAGTVSADKMKNAILSVARTLEQEFAGSAAKMANTVDSAFNRMKNAFTFAASDLGKSGLNQALIDIMNTATKFLQSSGLDKAMRILGATFKFIGEHINFFVTIMGTIALSSTLKWLTGLIQLEKILVAVRTAMAANAIATVAMATSTTGAVVATTNLTKAWRILNLVIRANPFVFVAAAIVGLILVMDQFTNSTQKNLDAVDANASSMADTESIYAAYINNVLTNTNALNNETQAYIANAQAAAYANRAKLGDIALTTETRRVERKGLFGLKYWLPEAIGGSEQVMGGEVLDKNAQAALKKLRDPTTGKFKIATTGREFAEHLAIGGTLEKYPGSGTSTIRDALKKEIANTLGADPAKLGFDPMAISKAVVHGDWTQQRSAGAGITGDPLEKAKKAKKGAGGKSEAEKWADTLRQNLETAQEALEDLGIEAQNTIEEINALLSGSLDSVAVAAQGAARQQIKNFEDAFKGPENKAKAVMALAAQLQEQKKIAADVDISNTEKSKAALMDYYTAQNMVVEQSKAIADVAGGIRKMREQNDVMDATMNITQDMSRTIADVTNARDKEEKLINISTTATMPGMLDALGNEVNARQYLGKIIDDNTESYRRLKEEQDLAEEQRTLEHDKRINAAMAPYQQAGTSERDLDYYRELIELRDKLQQSNATANEIQDHINVRAAILNEARAQDVLNKEMEKGRQVGQDMADAIVDAFRDATEGGQDFFKSLKDLFKNLKGMILDFVLYNPMKQFLAQTLGGVMSSGFGTPQGGTSTTSIFGGGAGGSMAAGGSSIMTFAASALQSMVGGGGQSVAGGRSFIDANGDINMLGMGTSGNTYLGGDNPIIVSGQRLPTMMPGTIPPPSQQGQALDYFKKIEKIFDYKANGDAIQALGTAIKTGKGIGPAVSGAVGVAGSALAAYSMGNAIGKGVGSALGLGERGSNIAGGVLGGAAAGFTIAGPIGAAVGAVAGGILGFLKKKTKLNASFGNVIVGEGGIAVGDAGHRYGKGTEDAGKAAAAAGASIFNQFARNFDAILTPGKYGAFGSRQFVKGGESTPFYSIGGTTSKGKPIGTEGVDWMKGTESQVQAFALIQQVKRGMITGLSDTIKTIFQNTKAMDMESLTADLDVGKAFDEFIRNSFKLNDVQRQVMQLNTAWKQLSRSAKELGLDEAKLAKARQRLLDQMKDEFNFNIKQGILEISNPAQAAFNALVEDYKDAVATAMAVGGDLTQVEKLYGMKRVEMSKQWADMATNGLVSAAKDLLTQLRSSSASPLNVSTVFSNSQKQYMGLVAELNKGDYSNVDKLATYTQNYLDASRDMYGSSTQYFDIFDQVTKFLEQMSELTGGVGTGGESGIPGLPSMKSIVAEINEQSIDMIEEMGAVGQAVMESGNMIVNAINNLSMALGYTPTSATPSPTTPTPLTGGTSSTGSGYSISGSGGGILGQWLGSQSYK